MDDHAGKTAAPAAETTQPKAAALKTEPTEAPAAAPAAEPTEAELFGHPSGSQLALQEAIMAICSYCLESHPKDKMKVWGGSRGTEEKCKCKGCQSIDVVWPLFFSISHMHAYTI